MPELIHPIAAQDVTTWARTLAATFLRDPDSPEAARRADLLRRGWEPSRAWGMRDRGRWVGTLRTEERMLTVPGVGEATIDIPVDAVTNITVAATHRRQGLMREMLTDSLRAARERGDALSILIAAEWPIYGRFGYAPATVACDYTLRRARAGAAVAGDLSRVRQVEREEFGEVAGAVFAAARRQRAGQINRDQHWWNRVLGREGYTASDEMPHNWLIHDGDEGPDGLLAWKAKGDFGLIPPLATAVVWELAAAGDDAYRDLWSYISGIDAVDEVSIANRPVDEPVRWVLADARTLVLTQHVDFLWVCLLDVAAALAARRYAAAGEVVLEVTDDAPGGLASGRFRLTADRDEAECAPTRADPDVALSARALSSIYLGGYRLREQMLSDAVHELTPGALARLDVMFSVPRAPWNATWF
jgi:predicted acetyltransferase